jgi:Zn-dependent protease with chaperone function
VLWLTCGYYYLSLPLVLLSVIGLGVAALLWLLSREIIPLKLVALIVIAVGVTVLAVVRSLTIRPSEIDPGELLDLTAQPRLRAVLDEVAKEIDTRAVDNVYLTPGTELAVMERGGVFRQLRGMTERCLILGIGLLDGMKMGPFKAVLGHEYGHFSNKDTAGGDFSLAVSRSIHVTALILAEGGAATWYNPAWLFLICFNWVFLVVSQGASRLQEILADRWAAMAYGAKQFERGLRHVIERSIRFDARAFAILGPMVEANTFEVAPNFYAGTPDKPVPEAEVEEAVKQAIHVESSLADSHPSPEQRFEFVRSQTQVPTGDLSDSEEDVWTLFSNREEIERLMSRQIWLNSGMIDEQELEAAYE